MEAVPDLADKTNPESTPGGPLSIISNQEDWISSSGSVKIGFCYPEYGVYLISRSK
jgi:hypothetical protein